MADGKVIIDVALDKKEFEQGIKDIKPTAEKGFDILKNTAMGVSLAVGAIGVAIGTAGVNFNSQMQQYQAGFSTLLGSAEKANELVSNLQSMAAKTPFELTDLASASQTLLAFGVTSEKLLPILKSLGDVSMGNKERFSSLALAFGQVQSAGKLAGQDLLQINYCLAA